VPTITSQVQEDLPSLAEARQVEQLILNLSMLSALNTVGGPNRFEFEREGSG
jgi:hypothetical protein